MMTSKERMLAAITGEPVDYTPCSFMIFFNMYCRTGSVAEFIERQVAIGLDAYVHAGHLESSLHPEAKCSEWIEKHEGWSVFCRRIDTPKGPLTARYRQEEGWPRKDFFPFFNDWLVTRADEVLVKPEQDLEKLQYIFGPFRDKDIRQLKASASEARAIADQHQLLLIGGWKGSKTFGKFKGGTSGAEPIQYSDAGVMGCDAMAWLSGYEEIMVLAQTNPDIIREYARIIHEWNLKQIEIYLDVANPDMILRRGWYETTEFWTPTAYRSIIAPFLAREVALVHQAGKKFGYIMTSAFLPILDDILATGIDVLIGLDPKQGKGTEIQAVKQAFQQKRKAIWGGVSGALTVEQGTPEETEQAVIEALRVLAPGGGFILSPVDNVREDTEKAWQNTKVFIDTWKRCRTLPAGNFIERNKL
jgi:hypothetical protein